MIGSKLKSKLINIMKYKIIIFHFVYNLYYIFILKKINKFKNNCTLWFTLILMDRLIMVYGRIY